MLKRLGCGQLEAHQRGRLSKTPSPASPGGFVVVAGPGRAGGGLRHASKPPSSRRAGVKRLACGLHSRLRTHSISAGIGAVGWPVLIVDGEALPFAGDSFDSRGESRITRHVRH